MAEQPENTEKTAVTRRVPTAVKVILLSVAGLLGNYLKVTLFFNVDYLFGGIAVMLVILLYGGRWGVLAGFIASTYTYVLWNHPYAVLIFSCEALFISVFLTKARRNIVLLDVLYWVPLGALLVGLFYGGVMGMARGAVGIIMLKQSLNGIGNAVAASIIFNNILPYLQPRTSRGPKTSPLYFTLFHVMIALVLVPSLVLLISASHRELDRQNKQIGEKLDLAMTSYGARISTFVDERRRVLDTVRGLVVVGNQDGKEGLAGKLELLRKNTPGIYRIVVTDGEGVVVVRSPDAGQTTESPLLDLSGNPSFRELRKGQDTVLSDTVAVPGEDHPVVALGTSIRENGIFRGAAFVFFHHEFIREFFKKEWKIWKVDASLLDSGERVITSTRDGLVTLSSFDRWQEGNARLLPYGFYEWTPDPKENVSVMERWKRSFYMLERHSIAGTPWSLALEVPIGPYRDKAYALLNRDLLVVMCLVIVSIGISGVASRAMLKALFDLQRITTEFPEKLAAAAHIEWPVSSILEVSSLVRNFREMVDLLRKQFVDLQGVNQSLSHEIDERIRSETEVRRLNETLEQRVRERTAELTKAATDLQTEASERRRAEEDALESRQRLMDMLENISLVSVMLDDQGNITFCNDYLLRLTGWPRGEIEGRNWFDLFVPDPEIKEAYLSGIGRGIIDLHDEGPIRTRTGVHRIIRWNNTELKDAAGNTIGMASIGEDITEQKHAENLLRRSEERLSEAQRIASIGNWEWNMLEGTLWWSEEVYRIFHVDPDRFAPSFEAFLGMIHPDDRIRVKEEIRDAIAQAGPAHLDYRLERADGEIRYIHEETRTVWDEAGRPVRRVGTVQDLTEIRRAESRLLEKETRETLILNSLPIGFYIADPAREFATTWVSPQINRLTGYEEGAFVEDPGFWQGRIHPDDRSTLVAGLNQMLTTDRFAMEYRFQRGDGQYRWFLDQAVLMRDPGGNPKAVLGTWLDISEKKETEVFLQTILETVDEGFIIIDPDFRIVNANRAYCDGVNRPVTEVLGKHCHEVSHGIVVPCFAGGEKCPVQMTFETGLPQKTLHTHFDAEKKPMFVEIKSFPVRNDTGEVTAAIEIVNDVTERQRLEEQLRHAQKMEAVGQLAGGTAHDFNNILTAIIGYANLMEMKIETASPLVPYIDGILSAADRAAALIQGLLAFSRKQVMKMEPVSVNGVIRRVEGILLRVIGEDIDLGTRLAVQDPVVMMDRGQMEQVLMNLATNARDAMPQGGRLVVETEVFTMDGEYVQEHGYGEVGAYVRIKVSDTGVGMDEKTVARIFEPFFTTKELGKGTGLGLAIIYGIIRQHGGFINVSSTPGQGTTFSIELPLVQDPISHPSGDPAGITLPRGTETILLAEDNDEVRLISKRILEDFGYTVIEARDGEEALAAFGKHGERVKLFLTDVIMPRMNGKETWDRLRPLNPDLKALFISGYTADVIHEKGILDENIEFLAKPISPKDLLTKVRFLLDG